MNNYNNLYDFICYNNIDFVCIGGETHLTNGIVNFLNEKNIKCFGPNKENSKLEGCKLFGKSIMNKFNLPTANYINFNNINDINDYI